jgi:hypothetical protein
MFQDGFCHIAPSDSGQFGSPGDKAVFSLLYYVGEGIWGEKSRILQGEWVSELSHQVCSFHLHPPFVSTISSPASLSQAPSASRLAHAGAMSRVALT